MARRFELIALGLVALSLVAVSGLLATDASRQLRLSQGEASDLRARVHRLEESVAGDEDRMLDAPRLISGVAPSVVTLFTATGLGTGFVIKSDDATSWIVTNFHVISDARGGIERSITVAQNGSKWPATLERWSEESDLAILRIDAPLPGLALAYGAGQEPQVGDPVMAYGSPEGLQGTATVGIISALRPGWIQTDAQVNHGNSGGPLVDRFGRVLGITSLGFVSGGSGLGFAIDARKVCTLLTDVSGCGES